MFLGVDRDKSRRIGFFGSSGGTSGFGLQIGTVPTRSGRLASMNHGLVEVSGQFHSLALCYYVSSRIASACACKARLPDAGCHRRQILILHHRTVHH